MIRTILLLLVLMLPISVVSQDNCHYDYVDLRTIVTRMGWVVTSEMGGGHNAHSRHYVGKAIDVSVRNKDQFDIDILTTVLHDRWGLIVRDERKRPRGQKVWRGSHLHLSIPYCQ